MLMTNHIETFFPSNSPVVSHANEVSIRHSIIFGDLKKEIHIASHHQSTCINSLIYKISATKITSKRKTDFYSRYQNFI